MNLKIIQSNFGCIFLIPFLAKVSKFRHTTLIIHHSHPTFKPSKQFNINNFSQHPDRTPAHGIISRPSATYLQVVPTKFTHQSAMPKPRLLKLTLIIGFQIECCKFTPKKCEVYLSVPWSMSLQKSNSINSLPAPTLIRKVPKVRD